MSNDPIRAALEPCPFCGSEASLEDERLLWVVRCSGCGACVLGDQAPEPEQELPESYWEPFRQSAVDRWNRRPAALPAPLEGEVGELVAWIHGQAVHGPDADEWRRAAALLQQQAAELARLRSAPLEGEAGELVEWLQSLEDASIWFETGSPEDRKRARAATLLQQLSAAAPAVVPVPVSERLPVAEDCDAEGRCWFLLFPFEYGRMIWSLEDRTYGCNTGFTYWLPFNAIPPPAPQGREVEG